MDTSDIIYSSFCIHSILLCNNLWINIFIIVCWDFKKQQQYLNKTKQYSLSDTYFYDDDMEICKDLDQILGNNTNKKVYPVNWKNPERNKQYGDKYNLTKVFDAGHYQFNLVGNVSAY